MSTIVIPASNVVVGDVILFKYYSGFGDSVIRRLKVDRVIPAAKSVTFVNDNHEGSLTKRLATKMTVERTPITCPKGHAQSPAEWCTPDYTGGCIRHAKGVQS